MADSYTTVRQYGRFEYEDRKSVFRGEALPVEREADAIAFIESAKKRFPDAKHHVYAYLLRENSIMRFSDDREPQGTAGMPVLDIIRKNSCTDVVIVVTRYFGGTLLGTGGLVHAYTQAALGALNAAEIITYDVYLCFKIKVSYSDFQRISVLFSEVGFKIEDTEYETDVTVFGRVKKLVADEFEAKIIEITAGRVQITKSGEKFDF